MPSCGDCIDPLCPLGNVTWFEAVAFANLLSAAHEPPLEECYTLDGCTGSLGDGMVCTSISLTTATLYDCQGLRLPTEAEWEYAIRAGTTTPYYSGEMAPHSGDNHDCFADENLERIAWYCLNAGPTTRRVGEKEPNGWGLYDMSGNAFEWVHDHYTPAGYGDEALTDPDGTIVLDAERVFRGGGFNVWNTACRSAAHVGASWDGRGPGLGFRLVRTIAEGS